MVFISAMQDVAITLMTCPPRCGPGPQRRVPGERQSHMLGMRTAGIPGT
jgi:hypothetical protein